MTTLGAFSIAILNVYLVRLQSGALAVFSPTALTPEVRSTVESMGNKVGYIAALDYEHHIFVTEWAKAYPSAKLLGVECVYSEFMISFLEQILSLEACYESPTL